MKNWTQAGARADFAFLYTSRNVHIWKDSGTGKTWLLKYLGTVDSSTETPSLLGPK